MEARRASSKVRICASRSEAFRCEPGAGKSRGAGEARFRYNRWSAGEMAEWLKAAVC